MRRVPILFLAAILCAASACGSGRPAPITPGSGAPTILELLEGGASLTYGERTTKRKCAALADAKKQEVCFLAASNAFVGIRFERTAGGLVFVAFGSQDNKEVIHVKGVVKIVHSDASELSVELVGRPEGKFADRAVKAGVMTFQLGEESTILLTDRSQTSLVYLPAHVIELPDEPTCQGGPCFLGTACFPASVAEATKTAKFPRPYQGCSASPPSQEGIITSPPAHYELSREATDAARLEKADSCCYRATHYAD